MPIKWEALHLAPVVAELRSSGFRPLPRLQRPAWVGSSWCSTGKFLDIAILHIGISRFGAISIARFHMDITYHLSDRNKQSTTFSGFLRDGHAWCLQKKLHQPLASKLIGVKENRSQRSPLVSFRFVLVATCPPLKLRARPWCRQISGKCWVSSWSYAPARWPKFVYLTAV